VPSLPSSMQCWKWEQSKKVTAIKTTYDIEYSGVEL
jgi:hypothetical protein